MARKRKYIYKVNSVSWLDARALETNDGTITSSRHYVEPVKNMTSGYDGFGLGHPSRRESIDSVINVFETCTQERTTD